MNDDKKTIANKIASKIMTDALIKALRECRSDDIGCEECPFDDFGSRCLNLIMEIAADRLEKLKDAERRAEVAEAELSRYTELLAKEEIGRAAAKAVLDEVYEEVKRAKFKSSLTWEEEQAGLMTHSLRSTPSVEFTVSGDLICLLKELNKMNNRTVICRECSHLKHTKTGYISERYWCGLTGDGYNGKAMGVYPWNNKPHPKCPLKEDRKC